MSEDQELKDLCEFFEKFGDHGGYRVLTKEELYYRGPREPAVYYKGVWKPKECNCIHHGRYAGRRRILWYTCVYNDEDDKKKS